eukprot:2169563-Rhodomonas_salina.4
MFLRTRAHCILGGDQNPQGHAPPFYIPAAAAAASIIILVPSFIESSMCDGTSEPLLLHLLSINPEVPMLCCNF